MKTKPINISFLLALLLIVLIFPVQTFASYHFSNFKGMPPIHVYKSSTAPGGISPSIIKSVYNLPATGGHGTIAIIGAYDNSTLQADLAVFNTTFHLPVCTTQNNCLEKHTMDSSTTSNASWSMETALDVEWSHAIAPNAKILLIEAKTASGANLLKAVDYAASRKDVVAISMSWGGAEFPEETSLDAHFKSVSGAPFFASSGDFGTGANWPAASPSVISVGGTHLAFSSNGNFGSESAWSGSGGGISAYEPAPAFQKILSIPETKNMRSIPDLSYDADPASGFPIYHTTKGKGAWYTVGGTSAGAPQWAAIESLGLSITETKLYADKNSSDSKNFFRDITSGSNGSCQFYCLAHKNYDFVTGLGMI